MPGERGRRDGPHMPAPAIAEVLVPLPHLVAIDRLPDTVLAGGVTVALTGAAGGVDVVGSLRAHVADARWRAGRRGGHARYEVLRTHADRCLLTVLLAGVERTAAQAVADEARRWMVAAVAPVTTPATAPVDTALAARLA